MKQANFSIAVIVAVVLSACGGDDNSAVGSEPAPSPAPAPAPAPAIPLASIDPLGTLNRSQTRGYKFKGGMSADADHIYASLYEVTTDSRLQQWTRPVFNQTDRTRWAIMSEEELAAGRYRLEVVSGRGSSLSSLQAMAFDVVNDLATTMDLVVEGGGTVIRLIDAYDGVTVSGVTEPNAQVGIEFWQGTNSTTTFVGDADSNGDFNIVYPREALPADGDYLMHVMRIVPGSSSEFAELPVSINVDPVRTVMSCEIGTKGGRYNFSKPRFSEEQQWIDLAPNGDILRSGWSTGTLNNLSATGSITNLNDGFFSWQHSETTRPQTGTTYRVEFALDGRVRASGRSGFAPVELVVTGYESCVPGGDGTDTVPPAPTIDVISGDDHLDTVERGKAVLLTGSGTPTAVVNLRTSFGYEESARVESDGSWSMMIFNLGGQTLHGVSGTHNFTAYVRYNEQNSLITSRPVSIAGDNDRDMRP